MRSVGLAVYDTFDAHFDRSRRPAPGAGRRLLVSRLEEAVDGGAASRPLAGGIEVSRGPVRGTSFQGASPDLSAAYGSLWGHFGGPPSDVAGLFLARDGTVHAYGNDLRLRPLLSDGRLRRALRAVLERV
jgi:hypothetical protein